MATPSISHQRLSFGLFEADLTSRELFKRGLLVPVQAQPFHLLAMLLTHPGEVVTREQFCKEIWPEGTFVDFNEGLDTALKKLRQALGDSAQNPVFVETIPRRGYRFIAPVRNNSRTAVSALETPEPVRINAVPDYVAPIDEVGGMARISRYAWLVTGLLLAAAAGGFYSRRLVPINPHSMQVIRLTDNGMVNGVAISPDGRFVVYGKREGEKEGLWIRQVATRSDLQILEPDAAGFHGLTFSPDGNYVYFVRSDKSDAYFKYLYSMPAIGGPVKKLLTDVDSPVSFSPNGQQFVYEHCAQPKNDIEIKIANADGTGDHLVAIVHDGSGFMFQPGPNWSPDGKTIAVPVYLLGKQQRWVLYGVSTATGRLRELYTNSDTIGRPVWISGGRHLLFPHYDSTSHRSQLWIVSSAGGDARAFTNDPADYDVDLDLTRDTQTAVAVATNTDSSIWTAPATDLNNLQRVTSGDLPMTEVVETSDGKLLVSDRDNALWIMNSDGSQMAPFGDARKVRQVRQCQHSLVFVEDASGTANLMGVGKSGAQRTKLASENLCCPVCAENSNAVFYVTVNQPQKIWKVPLTGGIPTEVGEVLGSQVVGTLAISPDGKFLAYPYTQYGGVPSTGRRLAVVPAVGGPSVRNFRIPADTGFHWLWSQDGKNVQYVLTKDGSSNIWEQRVAGGSPTQLTNYVSDEIFDFNWSHDHTKLLLARGSVRNDVILLHFRP